MERSCDDCSAPEIEVDLRLFTNGWGTVGYMLCMGCSSQRGLEWEDGETV